MTLADEDTNSILMIPTYIAMSIQLHEINLIRPNHIKIGDVGKVSPSRIKFDLKTAIKFDFSEFWSTPVKKVGFVLIFCLLIKLHKADFLPLLESASFDRSICFWYIE